MNRLELLLELKHNFQVFRKELSRGSLLSLSLSFIPVFNTIFIKKRLIKKVAKSSRHWMVDYAIQTSYPDCFVGVASSFGSFQHPETDKISIRVTGGQRVTGPGAAWCL